METIAKQTLPPMPYRIKALPVDSRGYPVPWFVQWIDGEPEFRVADSSKIPLAVRCKLCWVCGDQLGRTFSFVLGPMCVVNMNNAEPPCHTDCAVFSATACPFLTKPHMHRRENDLPDGTVDGAGFAIKRNPGAVCVWTCLDYAVRQYQDGLLFTPGSPVAVQWFAEGRKASRKEVLRSMETGLPILREMAEQQCPEAIEELIAAYEKAKRFLPKE